ncbi:hypothetical protein NST04_10720 [Paenibacillus sp. FSL H7-0756]|uniref:hypothetical protein n=1 Tax=unclassified Paenibacillus TaxID=185978 RepID=UPI0030F9E988
MPNYYFREMWTPLRLFGIRFYRDDQERLWIKKGKQRRKLVRKEDNETMET